MTQALPTPARRLGCKRPVVPPHTHKMSARLHPAVSAALAARLPSRTDWRASGLLPAVKDQGGTGSCEGHRASLCIEGTLAIASTPLGFTPSEDDLYRSGRSRERAKTAPVGAPLPDLIDDGCFTEDIFEAVAIFGIRPRTVPMTSDGRNSDVEEATVNVDQTLGEELAAATTLIAGEYAIDPNAPDAEDQLRAALAAGILCGIDFWCDARFQAWRGTDAPLDAPPDENLDGGGHAIAIVDYFTRSDGTRIYVLQNSWGVGNGDAGCYYVTWNFIRAAWGISIWTVRRAA